MGNFSKGNGLVSASSLGSGMFSVDGFNTVYFHYRFKIVNINIDFNWKQFFEFRKWNYKCNS
jgi:hypothetical protein